MLTPSRHVTRRLHCSTLPSVTTPHEKQPRGVGDLLLDPEAALEVLVSVDLAFDPLLTLRASLVSVPGDARLLRPAAADAVAEPLDRAGVHASLTEILPRDVNLGLLAGAAERDVGVPAVGLPAAGEDARGLGGDALGLVDVDGVAQVEVGELVGVDLDLARTRARGSRS